jgi:hypothetical protein
MNKNLEILQRQHRLLVRHGAMNTLEPLDVVEKRIQPTWCHNLVPILVPHLSDGQKYRQLISDVHTDLVKHGRLHIGDNVADDAFYPEEGNRDVRFTLPYQFWRNQSQTAERFKNGGVVKELGLFAALLYLLDVCTSDEYEGNAHPMWASAGSKQACVFHPRGTNLPPSYIRSESTRRAGGLVTLDKLVISTQVCQKLTTPFFLQDFAAP